MDLEGKNKEWLIVLKTWTNYLTDDGTGALDILHEFYKKRESLEKHMQDLIQWLSKNDIKEALKKLPSVGKLLSYLCKLPATLTTDQMSTLVVECMLHLSNMLTAGGKDENESSTKRAKYWAIKNFNKMTSMTVDGIDQFIMDEFGVSQNEFMQRHLEMAASDIVEASQCTSCSDHQKSSQRSQNEDDDELLNELLLIDNLTSLKTIDQILKADNNNMNCNLHNEFFRQNVLEKGLFCNLSIGSIRILFASDACLFERYIVQLIERVLKEYPKINRVIIEEILHEFRLLELLGGDERLLLGFNGIVKESFKILGNNSVLCVLLNVVNEAIDCKVRNGKEDTMLDSVLNELKKLHDDAGDICDIDKESLMFNLWFMQAKKLNEINKIYMDLFSKTTEEIQRCIELLVWFHHPIYTSDLSSVKILVTHVRMLKRLIPKKYLELNDLHSLISDLKKSLNNSLFAILIVIHVIFAANCIGAKALVKDLLPMIVYEDHQGSMFWFLYAMDILKSTSTYCKAEVLIECENQVKKLQGELIS